MKNCPLADILFCLETYGLINCSSGWKKDAANRCLELGRQVMPTKLGNSISLATHPLVSLHPPELIPRLLFKRFYSHFFLFFTHFLPALDDGIQLNLLVPQQSE